MRKVIALVLYFVIGAWLLLAALYALSVSEWLFDRSFYREVLDNPNLYENDVMLRAIVSGVIEQVTATPGFVEANPEAMDAITAAFDEVLPENYAQNQVQAAVDDILAYVEGENAALDVTFDVQAFRDALAEETDRERFATVLAENLPQCDRNQDPYEFSIILPECRPEDVSAEELSQDIVSALPGYLDTATRPITLQSDVTFQEATRVVRVVMTLGLVVAVALLLLIAWLGGRTLRGALLWLGVLGLLPASIVLLTGISVRTGIADVAIERSVDAIHFRDMTVSPEFRDALAETIASAASLVSEGFLLVGLIAVLVVLAVTGVGFVMPRTD